MNLVAKKIIFSLAFLFTIVMSATNHQPGVDDLDKVNEVIAPSLEKSIFTIEKVNAKEVKGMFRKIKRVDRLLLPKKKLSKIKYTIA